MRPSLPSTLLRQSIPRPALRPRSAPRSLRFSSTNPASSATEKKAQDSLASAQATAARLFASAKKIFGPVGEKAGQLLGSYKEPLFYNFAVARELVKQVYVAERLQPPSLAAVREVYQALWAQVLSPGAALRGVAQGGQVVQVGVYGLQAYGIFKIGEILGRRSLVGYKLE